MNKEIFEQLDVAILNMDMKEVDKQLERLTEVNPSLIVPEDVNLFSARIKTIYEKENKMKKRLKPLTIVALVAVLLVSSVTVYASGIFQRLFFVKEKSFVTVQTTEPLTQQQAEELVNESSSSEANQEQGLTALSEDFEFDTVEQAKIEMDMNLILPSDMPKMDLDSATGSIVKFGDSTETRTVWLDYSDQSGKMLGVTVSRDIIKENTPITSIIEHDMDEGSLGSYTTPEGVEYQILSESDPTGEKTANIATTYTGEYEYTLVFLGFTQAERESILNSTDLSSLEK